MFEMKEEFYTGIELIDEEHAELFRIAQRAYDLAMDEFIVDKYDNIIDIIDELKNYAKKHFADEEAYMESIQYKKLFTQKIEHNQFVEKLEEVDLRKIEDNQSGAILKLLEFLNDWLVEHIMEKDMLIGK